MLSRRSWAPLLASADSIPSLAALARALGFADPAPLDEVACHVLGIPDTLTEAHVAAGIGATRALLLMAPDVPPIREQVGRLASRLASRAPHLLWLTFVASRTAGQVVVAAWSAERIPPRVAALRVDRSFVLDSDVETLAALSAAAGANDLLLHSRWQEVLGRDALSQRFYRTLEGLVGEIGGKAEGVATFEDRREIALLSVSRLLFLAFLESKGWLDSDRGFLSRIFDDCMRSGGSFHRRTLLPLFFGTLNTRPAMRAVPAKRFGRIPFLNGGLFQRSPAETRARRLEIRDEEWGRLYNDLLLRYRFTAREESGEWTEAAIDPDMLGRAFESLMAARERRASGAYFTPQSLVERATDAALEALLDPHDVGAFDLRSALRGATYDSADFLRLRGLLEGLRILDPACGSGAFLVHALERLTLLRRATGDIRDADVVRRAVLTENLFGVDLNRTAVWLCELRLWLAVVIEHAEADPLCVTPLPNLDHNVRCGDALAGGDFGVASKGDGSRLAALRARYSRATGGRKQTLARALDREERAQARAWLSASLQSVLEERRALLTVARGRNLFGERRGSLAGEQESLAALRARTRELRTRLRAVANGGAIPFAFAAHFPEIAARGGFDLVIGNPPWVRLHRITPQTRERLKREFAVYRQAAWESGARDARAGRGFAAQVDLASLFVERGMALLRAGGVLSLLVPAKLWRSLAGGGVRQLLHDRHALCTLEDWSEAPTSFDAAVYPALVVARRLSEAAPRSSKDVEVALHRPKHSISWRMSPSCVALDSTPGSPWLVLPPEARAAFDRLTRRGGSLVSSGVGHPTLGVKCGLNEAFLVTEVGSRGRYVVAQSGSHSGEIESQAVRPVLRGEDVHPWRNLPSDRRIVFPCDDDGRVSRTLAPGVRAWLSTYRRRLLGRADLAGGQAWWSLFRTEAARSDCPRVVWADMGKVPQALVLCTADRTVPINTCYVVRCHDLEDAFALAALLNSAVAAAWLCAVAEPARGGYRRFLAWTVARLPVPDDWHRARRLLSPLGERGFAGLPPSRGELLDAVMDTYRMRLSTVAPLLEWMAS